VWIQGPNSIEKGEIEEIRSLNVNYGWNWKYPRSMTKLKNMLKLGGVFEVFQWWNWINYWNHNSITYLII
jgi:hypothetical protein